MTRTGWTSEVGYEVYLTDTSKGTDVYEAIMEAGQEFGIVPTGPSDIRIEGAIFNWGADMTYENNPRAGAGPARRVGPLGGRLDLDQRCGGSATRAWLAASTAWSSTAIRSPG